MQVRLFDGGTPPKFSDITAALDVLVVRNKMAPQFLEGAYSATIRKDLGFGNSVAQVTAFDGDPEVDILDHIDPEHHLELHDRIQF